MKPSSIDHLTTWNAADTAKVVRARGLDKLFRKAGIGAYAEELFGEMPQTFVHAGDVRVKGSRAIDAQGHGIYVIDGSLDVAGAFSFFTADAYTLLVVIGDLTAAHLQQAMDTQLVVLGETSVRGYLRLDPSDAGFAAFRGPVTCSDWTVTNESVEREMPTFAKRPDGRKREDGERLDRSLGVEDLHALLAKNAPLFAPDVRGAKAPSKAQLAKMTPSELLGCRGFASAYVTLPINPNYVTKGRPGQAFEKLELVGDTCVVAFPRALAELRELKILGYRRASPLMAMLRSLPQLAGLRTLRIVDTALGELPEEIARLRALEHLELRDNATLASLPVAIAEMKSLRRLELANNPLLAVPPALRPLVSNR